MLEVNDLSFSYPQKPILQNATFTLRKGEIGALIGPSGSGKTTLFKLLTGMITPQSGTIAVAGQLLPAGHGQVAYMTQDDLLLPWRTVLSNMTLIGELGKNLRPIGSLRQEARTLLREIGMEGREDFYPEQLSGGMRQRVSLARALLLKRPLLLLDEPFGSIDLGLREQLYALLRQIQLNHDTTMLMITHDFRDALSLSDRIYLLDDRHIKQEWQITPSIRKDAAAVYRVHEEMKNAMMRNEVTF
jgi:ABC-type nitrate/sulfonate/bicarbonate transport system ATPase subunit